MANRPTQHGSVGRYELLTRIATGGMAEIFLARERGLAGLERMVVIKRILPHLLDDLSFVEMFLREARIIARLAHPNVVQIYELGEQGGSYFIALEYIHGCTARELMVLAHQSSKPVPIDVALLTVIEACRGAHAAHELKDSEHKPLGLVHRDISPHNVMLTPDGQVKLLDFGVAKGTEGYESTSSGNLKGKYAYMSPEQCLHEPLDRRSDVFSLGIMLWEFCAGRRLFYRKTEIEMLQAITTGAVPRASVYNPALPKAIDDVLMKSLALEREDRYDSAEALRIALTEAAKEVGIELSTDAIGEYVTLVASDVLVERHEVLDKAKEQSLNSADAFRLSYADSSVVDEDSATVTDKPTPEVLRRVRDLPSEVLAAAFDEASVGSKEPTSTASVKVNLGPPRRKMMALVVVLVVALAALIVVVAYLTVEGNKGQDDEVAADPTPAAAGPPQLQETLYEAPKLVMGWAPTVDPEILKDELDPLRIYLQDAFTRPIEIVISKDYGDLADRVLSGEITFGMLPPLLYVRTADRSKDVHLVAVKEFDGATSSDGYLLVSHASGIKGLAELEGKRFCFTDKDSTTGNFLPRAHIRQMGYDPGTFIGEIHWSGEHLQVMRDLIDGKCEAAATYNGAFLTASIYGIPTGRIRVLSITGHVPQDVIVAGPAATEAEIATMRDALLSFSPADLVGLEKMGENQRITGFESIPDEAFDSLRAGVATETIDANSP